MHELLADVAPALDRLDRVLMIGTLRSRHRCRLWCGHVRLRIADAKRTKWTTITRDGVLVIKIAWLKRDASVIDESCPCPACAGGFSRGYLRHLFLHVRFWVLLSIHNLYVYGQLMADARQAIREGRYAVFRDEFLEQGHV